MDLFHGVSHRNGRRARSLLPKRCHAWALGVALVASAAAGCLPAQTSSSADSLGAQAGLPRGVVLEVHDDTGQEPAVQQAMDWWNGLAGRTLFAPATDGQWSGAWIYHDLAATNCPGEGVRACTSVADASGTEQSPGDFPYRWCDVMVQPGEAAWNVIAHELGHCLGFHHVADRVSIMGASSADPSNPAADQQMLRDAGY